MNLLKFINQNSFERAKPFILIGLHLLCLLLVFYFLSFWDFFRGFGGLKRWDAFWYERIATTGYEYIPGKECSSGFFPLFAYIWKLVPFGNKGIAFVNYSFFITGLLFLKRIFKFTNPFFLLSLSIPSMMFMYVPYTEALFFLSTSIFLYGLTKNNSKFIYAGIFIASITRPTAVFFIPAIVFMELMHQSSVKTAVLNIIKYSAVSFIGLFIVVIIQYVQTGVWFAYFKAQSNSWNRHFQLPEFPFTTWDGTRILWLDGIALFFGLLAIVIVSYFVVRRYLFKTPSNIDKTILFSFAYIAMAVCSVVFFNSKDALGGTSLMGANRYVMATPCFIILILSLSKEILGKGFLLIACTAVSIATALMLGMGTNILPYDQAFSNRYVLFTCVYALSYPLLNGNYKKYIILVLYTINVFAQIILLSYFTNGLWVG